MAIDKKIIESKPVCKYSTATLKSLYIHKSRLFHA